MSATASAIVQPKSARSRRRLPSLPGRRLTLGYTVVYLSLVVLIPLSAAVLKTAELGLADIWEILTRSRTLAALQLSFYTAATAALINAVFGTLVAWTLVRYDFPGKKLVDATIDLPFALPTAVAGIALTAIYARNGMFGQWLEPLGIQIAFTPAGITIALIFIGIPFAVRTVQPVLENFESELEEAAAMLGANRLQTIRRIILPTLLPAILTGFALSFARGVGEYGSVVFISGNMPMRTEIAPLLIVTQLEQYDYAAATAIAVAMLAISFSCLLLINLLQRWSSIRTGQAVR